MMLAVVFAGSIFLAIWTSMNSLYDEQKIKIRLKHVTQKSGPESRNPADSAADQSKSFLEKKSKDKLPSAISFVIPIFIAFAVAYVWSLSDNSTFFYKALLLISVFLLFRQVHQLRKKIIFRQLIEEALPMAIDLLLVCVEAGMSMNSAIVRVANEIKGSPLSDELSLTYHELNAGLPFENALRNLGSRTGVADLQGVTSAIIQGDKLGISLGETLRSQARAIRETIRMRTREKVFKIPIKMIPPLVLFIMPAIFTVLAGPAMLQVLNAFSSQ